MVNKLVEAVDEALAIAKGETPAARVWIQGHDYVPATELARVRNSTLEEAAKLCDKKLLLQHPMKPLGVAISSEPAAPAHAAAIRALATPTVMAGEGE